MCLPPCQCPELACVDVCVHCCTSGHQQAGRNGESGGPGEEEGLHPLPKLQAHASAAGAFSSRRARDWLFGLLVVVDVDEQYTALDHCVCLCVCGCAQESLGGNSLTCMLATLSPATSNFAESLTTLRSVACGAGTVAWAC